MSMLEGRRINALGDVIAVEVQKLYHCPDSRHQGLEANIPTVEPLARKEV